MPRPGKSLFSMSATWRADAERGSTRSSGKPHFTPRNGTPSNSSSATTLSPTGTARRNTYFVDRYQNFSTSGLCAGSRNDRCPCRMRCITRRASIVSSRGPSNTIAAGVITTAAIATMIAVATMV